MNKSEYQRIERLTATLECMGFYAHEIKAMRRISHTLSTWCERECNGEIERDETTNKPMLVWGRNREHRSPAKDMESSAIKRMNEILATRPELNWYYQTDPRGCSVYLYHAGDARLNEYPIGSIYSSIGIAIW